MDGHRSTSVSLSGHIASPLAPKVSAVNPMDRLATRQFDLRDLGGERPTACGLLPFSPATLPFGGRLDTGSLGANYETEDFE